MLFLLTGALVLGASKMLGLRPERRYLGLMEARSSHSLLLAKLRPDLSELQDMRMLSWQRWPLTLWGDDCAWTKCQPSA